MHTICLFIPYLIFSNLGPLWLKLLWTPSYRSLYGHIQSLLLSIFLGMVLMDHSFIHLTLTETASFPSDYTMFTFKSDEWGVPVNSTSPPTPGIINLSNFSHTGRCVSITFLIGIFNYQRIWRNVQSSKKAYLYNQVYTRFILCVDRACSTQIFC